MRLISLSILLLTSKLYVHGKLLRNLEYDENVESETDVMNKPATLPEEMNNETHVSNIFDGYEAYEVGMKEENYDEYCVPIHVCNERNLPISFDYQGSNGNPDESQDILPGQCHEFSCTKNYYFYYKAKEIGGPAVWTGTPCDDPDNLCWRREDIANKGRGYFFNLEYAPEVSNSVSAVAVYQTHQVGMKEENYETYCVPIHVCNQRDLTIMFDVQNTPGGIYSTADIPPGACAEYPCTQNYYFYYRAKEIGGTAVWTSTPCNDPNLCWKRQDIANKGRGYFLDLKYPPTNQGF